MRETLAFVRGAVADKENALPALTRFCITGGRIQGSNGRIVIDAPCAELKSIEALVPADRFLRAIDACLAIDSNKDPKIEITDAGRLAIALKPFRASLPITPVDTFPRAAPTEGKRGKALRILPVLAMLRPFIGEDSTRPWCLTIYSDGENAYATNSAMIASMPVSAPFQLPVFLIDELLRIGVDPTEMTTDERSATFFYPGDAWLRSQLIGDEWPVKTAQSILDFKAKLKKIPDGLVESIESIVPFCANPKIPLIHFTDRGISTQPGETQAEIEGAGWPPLAFDARNLLPMLRSAARFGIDPEAGRALIEGEGGFRGALMGRKIA